MARPEVAPVAGELSWLQSALRWDCQENCRYECMIENRQLRRSNGEQAVQYMGKWAFTRVLGVQELFSSLFSFLNGLPYTVISGTCGSMTVGRF